MSLTVSPTLLKQAQISDIRTPEFIDCIKDSLPYAWQMIEDLADRLSATDAPLRR